jgi:hypothetical protein
VKQAFSTAHTCRTNTTSYATEESSLTNNRL